ncbi:MAG: type II secretion system major pseudopilin GspG [Coxiellaceae bacterium]|nr:MAG: type II secretion system major pseudopilin GspG [Coxiellaceae bacterium]
MLSKSRHSVKGFTLIEVMVVVVILAILAVIVAPKFLSRPEQAREVKAKQDILAIQSALDLYKLDNGFYPTTEQGLQALVTKPSAPPVPMNWKEDGYLNKVPIDPWGHAYHYVNDNERIQIFTYGRQNQPGKGTISNVDQQ